MRGSTAVLVIVDVVLLVAILFAWNAASAPGNYLNRGPVNSPQVGATFSTGCQGDSGDSEGDWESNAVALPSPFQTGTSGTHVLTFQIDEEYSSGKIVWPYATCAFQNVTVAPPYALVRDSLPTTVPCGDSGAFHVTIRTPSFPYTGSVHLMVQNEDLGCSACGGCS